MPNRVLLTGGGTGGHVFPALAVGEELDRRGWDVIFVGRADSLESRVVSGRGVDFHALPAMAVLGRGLVDRARALVLLARSALAARRLVRSLGVNAVVATGGYVSVPAAVGARLAGVPLVLLEPNARPGLANRWLSRLASVAATAFAETASGLRCRSLTTGVPVARAFFDVGVRGSGAVWRLLVLGGSQGAVALNRSVPAALSRVAGRLGRPVAVLHQAGAGKEEEAVAGYADFDGEVKVVRFLDDVSAAMAAADLVLSRSGAITLAELCAAGRPSLLFPLAIAAGHQAANAAVLAKAGAALVVSEPNPEVVQEHLLELLGDDRLETMAVAARSLARPRAAADIADIVEDLGGRN